MNKGHIALVTLAAIGALIFNPQSAPAQTITRDFAERTMRSVLPPNAKCARSLTPTPRSYCIISKEYVPDVPALDFEYIENIEPWVTASFYYDQSGKMSGPLFEVFVDFLSKFGLPKKDILDCLSTVGAEKVRGNLALQCATYTDAARNVIGVYAKIEWNRF